MLWANISVFGLVYRSVSVRLIYCVIGTFTQIQYNNNNDRAKVL